ncbi:hypothetical protein ABZ442_15130 [Streptomyces triculaminicus]
MRKVLPAAVQALDHDEFSSTVSGSRNSRSARLCGVDAAKL